MDSEDERDLILSFPGLAAGRHVDPLAMQRLFNKPGLETVLEAVQFYRSKRMGHIGWSPQAFGSLKDDHSWLCL